MSNLQEPSQNRSEKENYLDISPSPNMQGMFARIGQMYDGFLEYLVAGMMAVLIIMMFAAIVLRTFFNSPIVWAEEVARYLFIWTVYIGASIAWLKGGHLRVDFLVNSFPPPVKRWVETITHLIIIVFLFYLMIYGTQFVSLTWNQPTYSMRGFKIAWAYLSVPTGAVLMTLNMLRVLPDIWQTRGEGVEE